MHFNSCAFDCERHLLFDGHNSAAVGGPVSFTRTETSAFALLSPFILAVKETVQSPVADTCFGLASTVLESFSLKDCGVIVKGEGIFFPVESTQVI